MSAVMQVPFRRSVFSPSQIRSSLSIKENCWAYVYEHPREPWILAIATMAEPESRKLSLGGFRIVPAERESISGFDPIREAVHLAIGMDEKVYWSRLMRIAGPRGRAELPRVVGGKCVLLPGPDSRVGERRDRELLDFAVSCLEDAEESGKFLIVTGQDLGHGIMSDGATPSLHYLNHRFKGSVLEDTSQPTGEGNFFCLKGMLEGCQRELEQSGVGFIGCGNVGFRVFRRVRELGGSGRVIEPSHRRHELIEKFGGSVWSPNYKQRLLSSDIHALCVNANGGSLDAESIKTISSNPAIQVVCGSENLAVTAPCGEELLLASEKLMAPTELCGMMGYLTAVEEYLLGKDGEPFRVETMMEAARLLEEPAREAVGYCRRKSFRKSFSQAIREMYLEASGK